VWAYLENNNLVDDLFHKKGIFYTVVNININYRRGAVVGDILRIETEVKKTGRCKIIMSQKIFLKDSDTLIADAEVIYVFIDMKTGKVISVDNEIISLWHDLSKTFGGYSKPRWNRVLCVIYPTAGIL
ncbi:MAG: acyl-CoA thioesterase, partial [Methanosarcinales archaeon]